MKDLLTLAEYSNISHSYMPTAEDKNALFPIKVSNNKMILLPGPEFSTLLYRGQNRYFEVCKPTLSRQITADEKVISILKKLEFKNALKTHALSKIFQENDFFENTPHLPNYKLKLDFEATAQHYEFKTNHLDFTRDKNIAMFFLTCKYDSSNRFTPITDNSYGILYSYNMKYGIEHKTHHINPIGFQPFSRPDKQKAFSILFNRNKNFNNFDFIEKKSVRISKELSEKYFEMFDEGKKLFPKDEISSLANELQHSNYISKDTFEYYSTTNKISKNKLKKVLNIYDIILTENKYSFATYDRKLHQKNTINIFNDLNNRIHTRGCCSHFQA